MSDRRTLRRSARKFLIAADYLSGVPVKNIIADHGCDLANLYRIVAEFNLALRQPRRQAAIKAARSRASMDCRT